MNPEIKEKWIAALESGEFEQGQGSLYSQGKYCCLGVLCELAVREGIVTHNDADERSYGEHSETGGLPDEVQQWAQLPHLPIVQYPFPNSVDVVGLHYLNDMANPLTFPQIAELIKEQL